MSDVHPALETATVHPGATLGRYELLAPIGSGGMASVWAARLRGQGGFSKLVALKMILPELATQPELQQMFFDEARIAAKLHHPNVCETFDLGDHEGTLFIAMEWVEGVSLATLARGAGARIELRLAARIVAEACAGLHAAHELVDDDGTPLGVVHRDVSPHNLLVSATGCVKVTDFGVAKARGKSHATAAGQLKGKIAYMSPEHLKSAPIDGRSDVFALGCVLYEITTGRRPFPGRSEAQVVSGILRGRVAPPSSLDEDYPSELEAIVMQALATEREARFRSADEMRLALEAYLATGEPVGASAIAELVKVRCSAEIEQRRERVRAECALRGTSSVPPAFSPSCPRESIAPSGQEHAVGSAQTELARATSRSAMLTVTRARRMPRAMGRAVISALLGLALIGGSGWRAMAARPCADRASHAIRHAERAIDAMAMPLAIAEVEEPAAEPSQVAAAVETAPAPLEAPAVRVQASSVAPWLAGGVIPEVMPNPYD